MTEHLQSAMKRARKSPSYQHLSKNSSFHEMPITLKKDLRDGYPFGFLAVDQEQVVSYHESTGTEGKPISSYFTVSDWDDVTSRFLRNAVSLTAHDIFFIKTPYSMVTTAHQAHRAAEKVNALVVPADNRSSNMSYARVIQLMKDLGVTVTWSLPTEVLLWRLALELQKKSPQDFTSLRAFWVAGEPLSNGRKMAISELWNGKAVFEDYGSTETGSLAGNCEKGKLHAWSDRIKFEVFHPEDRTITDFGKGHLLVTPLFREAMPLIRYLIEDEVELTESNCVCGSKLPMLSVLGRSRDAVRVGNRTLYPLVVEDSVFRTGRANQLILWRGFPMNKTLQIDYFGLERNISQVEMEDMISAELNIEVRVSRKDIRDFVDPERLMEHKMFSKPRFLFHRREASLQGIDYA